MILVNTDQIAGREVMETLGLVRGNTIQAKWLGKDIMSVLRMLVGGELKEYSEMLTEAREIALERMVGEAEKLHADAIVNIRFQTRRSSEGPPSS